jgi:hypothetical protein
MKRYLLLVLILLVSFVGCTKAKDKSNSIEALLGRLLIRNQLAGSAINSELPSNLAVPVPRSIRKPSTSARSLSLIRTSHSRAVLDSTDLASYYDSGYSGQIDLQAGGDYIAEILQESKRDLILLSSTYSKAKASPGVCIPGGTGTSNITQGMINEMIDGLENLGLSNEEAKAELANLQEEGVLPSLGQAVPSPAMIYRTSSNADYDVELSYSFSDSITSPVVCPTNNRFQKILKFKSDFSKIFSSSRKTVRTFGTTIEIIASITNFSGTGKKDKTVLNFRRVLGAGKGDKTVSKTKFIIEQCNADASANAGNCVTLGYRNEENYSGSKYTTKVEGRTDDDGGYIRTDYYDGDAGEQYLYEEAFNANRDLDYYSMEDANGDIGEEGDFSNYDKYYEDTYRFEDQIVLGFVDADQAITATDGFVIYPTGVDPNTDSIGELQLGEGSVFDEDSSSTVESGEYYVDYYGELSDFNAGLKVWKASYDNDGNVSYTILSSAALNII